MNGTDNIAIIAKKREKKIIKTSVIGVIVNLFLVGFKMFVGFISGSVAVILDAVNNLSDALSSVITIFGTMLAGRKPDKKHPLGHGRIEYITSMIIAAIVIYAGVTAFVESVKKIINPEPADYSTVSLIIISVAIAVKIVLGLYVRGVGKSIQSTSLVASGSDALFDAIISTSVLVSALIFIIFGISLEAYLGLLISLLIIKTGVGILLDTFDEILGKRADRELVDNIKKTICEEEEVNGAFDLILHNYGPKMTLGSVHIEIPDTMTADKIDSLERRIAAKVYEQYGVILAGIGIYSMNTSDDKIKDMMTDIISTVTSNEGVLQIHGFHADTENKAISLDIILDFALPDRNMVFNKIVEDVKEKYPDYQINFTMDIDV